MRPLTTDDVAATVADVAAGWLQYVHPQAHLSDLGPQFRARVHEINDGELIVEMKPVDDSAAHPDDAQPVRYRVRVTAERLTTTTKDEQ